jgi:hypothetical protein
MAGWSAAGRDGSRAWCEMLPIPALKKVKLESGLVPTLGAGVPVPMIKAAVPVPMNRPGSLTCGASHGTQ